jgi:multidrug efflux system membrane fusion protein
MKYFLILVGGAFLIGCSHQAPLPAGPPPAPVTVAEVVRKTVPLELQAIGSVQPYSTVEVKAQVGGVLEKVHFQQGQEVKKGDLLFTIDPAPYELALRQAIANQEKSLAQAENATGQAQRYNKLTESGAASKEQFEQIRTTAVAQGADIHAAQAAVENAKLQLDYCTLRSPIDGRVGDVLVHEGNLVKANADSGLVVINQIKPVYVRFSLPEKELGQVKKYSAVNELKTTALASETGERLAEGALSFVDNKVEATTGTIELKATFANDDETLWPGQYVSVVLTLTEEPDAILVPSDAVQTGQNGQHVIVVKADNSAEVRPVKTERAVGSETIISEGLKPGEKIVVVGHLRVVPGGKVEIKNATNPPAASIAASADK